MIMIAVRFVHFLNFFSYFSHWFIGESLMEMTNIDYVIFFSFS